MFRSYRSIVMVTCDMLIDPAERRIAAGWRIATWGEYKVYVAPFPGPGGKWLVSSGSGYSPRSRRDGREIFYFSPDNEVMAVDVRPAFNLVEVGTAHPLFETFSYGVFGRFDVTPDGQRFIVPFEAGEPSTAITLVINWPLDLKR